VATKPRRAFAAEQTFVGVRPGEATRDGRLTAIRHHTTLGTSPVGEHIDAEMFGWNKRKREPRSSKDGGLLVGWGVATATYPGYRFPASARALFTADGQGVVLSATHELGTGAYTIFTQGAADALGLPVEKTAFELGDSTLPPSTAMCRRSTCTSTSPTRRSTSWAAAESAKWP